MYVNRFPILLFFLGIIFSNTAISQEWKFTFASKVDENDRPLAGASVILKDDKQKILKKMIADSTGKFKLSIPQNKTTFIEVTKKGYVKKIFRFETKNAPNPEQSSGYVVEVKGIALFKPLKGVDYSLLDKPLIAFKYSADSRSFDYDSDYMNQVMDKLEAVMKAHKEALKKQ
jgi:hypothetical protein